VFLGGFAVDFFLVGAFIHVLLSRAYGLTLALAMLLSFLYYTVSRAYIIQ